MNNPLKYFAQLLGPGVERTPVHWLITIAAVLSGSGRWDEIEGAFGKAKRLWFKGLRGFPRTTPTTCSNDSEFKMRQPFALTPPTPTERIKSDLHCGASAARTRGRKGYHRLLFNFSAFSGRII